MKFPTRRKLMPSYASLSSPPLTLCWNKCFVHMKYVQMYGHRQSYYVPMTLNVFMVFVRIFSLLLLREVLVLWLNIWAKFMPFFMSLISYYLLSPLQSKNLSNNQSYSCCWHYIDFLMNIPMFVSWFWVLLLCPTLPLLVLPFLRVPRNQVIDILAYADDSSVLASQRDDCNVSR